MVTFDKALAQLPLVAILRGIGPDEVDVVGEALVESGLRLIEVPLNSPDPFASIERLAKRVGDRALIGAGTVLSEADVGRVYDAGGRMIVSPNTDVEVIEATIQRSMSSVPGCFTPTEAFTAIAAGATALKLFPGEGASPQYLRALRTVLPPSALLLAVGGVNSSNISVWWSAGANGFGIGSAIYRPGDMPSAVAANAQALIKAFKG